MLDWLKITIIWNSFRSSCNFLKNGLKCLYNSETENLSLVKSNQNMEIILKSKKTLNDVLLYVISEMKKHFLRGCPNFSNWWNIQFFSCPYKSNWMFSYKMNVLKMKMLWLPILYTNAMNEFHNVLDKISKTHSISCLLLLIRNVFWNL